jgi:hypothetical protein
VKLALLVPALTVGCLRTTTFHCTGDADCTNGGITGVCQSTTSLCSFPDSSCTSGQRYGDLSGSLANKCTDTSSPMPDAPPGYFYVGGTVSGLTGSGLVLRDNGADDLARSSNGPFQFATALQTGKPYAVTVGTQPSMQTCTVASGTGTIASADVTNVAVTCASGDVGIFCGGSTYCTVNTQVCCNPAGTESCTTSGACGSTRMSCDDAADCVGNANGSICCARYSNNGNYQGSLCQNSCNSPSQPMCDPSVATPCASGTCQQAAKLPTGYHTCQ